MQWKASLSFITFKTKLNAVLNGKYFVFVINVIQN